MEEEEWVWVCGVCACWWTGAVCCAVGGACVLVRRGSGWGLCVSWERQWAGLVCWWAGAVGGACVLVGRGSGWGLCVSWEGQWVGLVRW